MSALFVILLPATVAIICLLTNRQERLNRWIGLLGNFGLLLASLYLFKEVLENGYIVVQPGGWPAPFGITIVADMFSASMVLITAIVGLCVSIYSWEDIPGRLIESQFSALCFFLLMGVNGAFLAGDLFNLYVWFEVMLLASFVLIAFGRERSQLEGGVKYLVINLVSSMLFLAGVGLLYGKLGTLNMADIAQLLAETEDAFLVNSSAMLLLVSFGVKAALFPLFFWLPAAYHTPPISISALFAGLLTKVGVYALIRSFTLLFHSQFEVVQVILIFLAAATMVTGVLGAAAHYDIRKILSFHIISQIGYIVMGLAVGSALALAGAIFYTLHHIIVKTNLFFIAGLIERKCGTFDLKACGGLYRFAPGLALLFFVPAFSLGGIPPLSGFWAKFLVIQSSLLESYYLLAAVALLVGILTLYSMTKIWNEAFWKSPPDEKPDKGRPLSWTLLLPCLVLGGLTLLIGFWSAPLMEFSKAASEQLMNPEAYIEAVLTATGGYDAKP